MVSHSIDQPNSPVMIFKDIERNCIRLKNEKIRDRRKSTSGDESNLKEKLLDCNNWSVLNLTEEEALKEFRMRADDPKYLGASYKCGDCFRGFSKESMLRCHIQLKHSEVWLFPLSLTFLFKTHNAFKAKGLHYFYEIIMMQYFCSNKSYPIKAQWGLILFISHLAYFSY